MRATALVGNHPQTHCAAQFGREQSRADGLHPGGHVIGVPGAARRGIRRALWRAGDGRHPGIPGEGVVDSGEDVRSVLGGGGDVAADAVPVASDLLRSGPWRNCRCYGPDDGAVPGPPQLMPPGPTAAPRSAPACSAITASRAAHDAQPGAGDGRPVTTGHRPPRSQAPTPASSGLTSSQPVSVPHI